MGNGIFGGMGRCANFNEHSDCGWNKIICLTKLKVYSIKATEGVGLINRNC